MENILTNQFENVGFSTQPKSVLKSDNPNTVLRSRARKPNAIIVGAILF